MGWSDHVSRKMREWLCRAATKPDTSDQPDLGDVFVAAPPKLAQPIRLAGGDPSRVVRWFECDTGDVFRFTTTGRAALESWKSLRSCFDATGYWPIILGANLCIQLQDNLSAAPERDSVARILERAEVASLETWLADLRAQSEYPEEERSIPSGAPWPGGREVQRMTDFTAPYDCLTGRPLKQVWIGLLPVRHFWHAAAVMNFGDWNEVPPPEVHVSLHRKWASEYGVELVTITNDVIEFRVERPPQSKRAAMELAETHYHYCPDIVDQGVGSIEALAAGLLSGRIWYFWWD